MSTGSVVFYDSFAEQIGKAANLGSDSFKMLLTTSSYTPNVATHSVLADVTNEVSGGGYARQTLSGVTFNQVNGDAYFDFNDVVFPATGAGFTAYRFVIYDDSVASPTKPLVCSGLLDITPAAVTVTNGNSITFQPDPLGLFVLSV